MEICREVRRVLRPDGVFWLNYGDCYSAAGWESSRRNVVGAGSIPPDERRSGKSPGIAAGSLMMMPHRVALALQQDGWIVRGDPVWNKPNPMPESIAGTRWIKHRIKVAREDADWQERPKGWQAGLGGHDTGSDSKGQYRNDDAQTVPKYVDCPGCEKCIPNDGLVLKRGSWRHTRSHEFIFMLVKSMGYWSNQEAVREGAEFGRRDTKGAWRGGIYVNQSGPVGADKEKLFNSVTGKHPETGRNPRSVLDVTEQRHYELPDGTTCIVSEDCPVHGHQQSVQIQQMELDGEQATLPLSHNEGIDGHELEPASESLSSSDHSNQEPRQTKKGSPIPENESEHNPENIDANKTEESHSLVDDADAQKSSDNESTEALATYPSEGGHSCSDDSAAKAHSTSDHKKRASSAEPDRAFGPEVQLRIDHNESVCSCRWIIPRAHYAPSVLDVPTAPYRAAHYATYPPNLIAPLIRATCPRWACPVCGHGWAVVVDKGYKDIGDRQPAPNKGNTRDFKNRAANMTGDGFVPNKDIQNNVLGYRRTCEHEHTQEEAVPGIVLDPFVGSGTSVAVAKQLLRRGIGIDISMEYLDQQAKVRAGLGTPSNALEDLPLFENLLE